MDEERKRKIQKLIRKNKDIGESYELLLLDIAEIIEGRMRDNTTMKEMYNIYLREIVRYPDLFPTNVQDIIIEKAKLEPNEIIDSYIDEVEKNVEKRNGEYMSLYYLLGEIFLYKLDKKYQ